jgi:hypothetical protein
MMAEATASRQIWDFAIETRHQAFIRNANAWYGIDVMKRCIEVVYVKNAKCHPQNLSTVEILFVEPDFTHNFSINRINVDEESPDEPYLASFVPVFKPGNILNYFGGKIPETKIKPDKIELTNYVAEHEESLRSEQGRY